MPPASGKNHARLTIILGEGTAVPPGSHLAPPQAGPPLPPCRDGVGHRRPTGPLLRPPTDERDTLDTHPADRERCTCSSCLQNPGSHWLPGRNSDPLMFPQQRPIRSHLSYATGTYACVSTMHGAYMGQSKLASENPISPGAHRYAATTQVDKESSNK